MDFIEIIQKKVAISLTVFEYAAVSLLTIAVIGRLAKIQTADIITVIGTALVAFAPVAGIITAGVISLQHKKRNLSLYSIIIVAIYIAAFLLAR